MTGPATTARSHVLVVEDDHGVRDTVVGALASAGYEARSAGSADDARAVIRAWPPDLLLLDVMLPDLDGFAFADELVAGRSRVMPIIFLTALGSTEARVRGLGVGDDYVCKPFAVEELLARVAAVLRRARSGAEDDLMRVGTLELDLAGNLLRADGGPEVALTPTEAAVLAMLMRAGGRVVPKADLQAGVWNYEFAGRGNVVETYVSYLRRKLAAFPEVRLRTVRGAGYALEPVG